MIFRERFQFQSLLLAAPPRPIAKDVRCKWNKMALKNYSERLQEFVVYSAKELIIPLMDPTIISTEPNKFSYSLLLKFNNGLESLNILLLNIHSKPQFADSICIILRALLADVITLEYATYSLDIDEQRFSDNIDNIYFDHVKGTSNNPDFQHIHRLMN